MCEPEEVISPPERAYLEKLFKAYGFRYFILKNKPHRNNQKHIRVRTDDQLEIEFGEVRIFLSLSREQQIQRIKKKLNTQKKKQEKDNAPP